LGIAHYLIGGLVIGLAVSFLYVATGLVGGMSTFFTSTWSFFSNFTYFQRDEFVSTRTWRLFYAAGLILGAVIWLVCNSQWEKCFDEWHSYFLQ
jgi:hypothetical protein